MGKMKELSGYEWCFGNGSMPKEPVELPKGIRPIGEILKPTTTKECNHIWVEYVGFTESFHYCKLCDKRRHDV